MAQYIDKDALVAEIRSRLLPAVVPHGTHYDDWDRGAENERINILSLINTLEVKEVDLENNSWIDCRKQMPPETTYTSDTLQGRKGWTKSDPVLAWDSMYGCRVDATKNGKWMSEQGNGYTGQVVHGIIAWRTIPKFDEELLIKEQKGK